MPVGITSPKQAAMLAEVLAAYCGRYGVPKGPERVAKAAEIRTLFDSGYRTRTLIRRALAEGEERGRSR